MPPSTQLAKGSELMRWPIWKSSIPEDVKARSITPMRTSSSLHAYISYALDLPTLAPCKKQRQRHRSEQNMTHLIKNLALLGSGPGTAG
jgi:hypothetical protein